MAGYGFMDNIHRQKEQDKLQLEDREYQKQRALKHDARQEKQDARQEKQDTRTETLWGREDQQYADQMALRDVYVQETKQIFGDDIAADPTAVQKVGGMLQNPERTGGIIALHEQISGYISQGKTPPNDVLTKYLNLVGAEELTGRSAKDGLQRSVESVVPSTRDGELHIGFDVVGKDGKSYKAPMTEEGTTTDEKVKSIPLKKIMEWGNGGAATAKAIAIAKAKLGDRSFLDAYHAQVAAQGQRAERLQDYEMKKQIDLRYEKPSAPRELPGKWVESTEGWKYIREGETAQSVPKIDTKVTDDGRIILTKGADVVVMEPDDVLMQRAAEMANEQEAQESKGLLNFGQGEAAVAENTKANFEALKAQQEQAKAALVGLQPQPGQAKQPAAEQPQQEQPAAKPITAASLLDKYVGQPKTETPKQAEQKPAPLPIPQKRPTMSGPLVSTSGLDDVIEIAKRTPGFVKEVGKAAWQQVKSVNDVYQQLLGQPAMGLADSAKRELSKNLLAARLQNGVITEADYQNAISLLEN